MGLTGAAVEPTPDGWWKSFDDPQLDSLIRAGLKDSPNLAQAQARVADALARSQIAQSKRLPSANLDASAFYQRAPENFAIPPPLAGHYLLGGAGGRQSLSWDLDFFGKQANAVHSAQALSHAAELDVENAKLLLGTAIAQSYVELYRENALADIAERSAAQRENIVAITRRRVAAGVDTQLELRQAEGQLPQAHVARDQAQAAADLAVHELAALTGQGADAYASIKRPVLNLDAALPVPTALPINLLARRPDVLSARLNIEAADSQRLSDRAAFYPDINLKALAGIGAFGLNNLVQWSARGYGVGPAISLPLFDGGRLRAQYKSSEAQLDGAIAGYNDTVLRAVQQTADQLTRIDALGARAGGAATDPGGQRSGLQTGRGALSRRPRELPLRAQRGDSSSHCAPNDGRHRRESSHRAGHAALRHRRQLRCARHGRKCSTPFRSSFDTGNTMNSNDSNDTTPSAARRHQASRTRTALRVIRLGRRGPVERPHLRGLLVL